SVSAGAEGGDMVRLTHAAIAFGCTVISASQADAAPARAARGAAVGAALITNCYKMADRIGPRMRGRSGWVGRHADHSVRGGGEEDDGLGWWATPITAFAAVDRCKRGRGLAHHVRKLLSTSAM